MCTDFGSILARRLTSRNRSCSVDIDSAGCANVKLKARAVASIPAPICGVCCACTRHAADAAAISPPTCFHGKLENFSAKFFLRQLPSVSCGFLLTLQCNHYSTDWANGFKMFGNRWALLSQWTHHRHLP
eukprot:764995-Pelagomonas_calceolata.AAC.4